MDQRSDEVDELRQRLVSTYRGPAFDLDGSIQIVKRLNELVVEMNQINGEKLIQLKEMYDNGIGVRSASRRLFLNRNTVLKYYHDFRLAGGRPAVVPTFGDPPFERSALNGCKVPVPPVIKQMREVKAKPKPEPTPYTQGPSAEHVAFAIVLATAHTGGDPILVASGDNAKSNRWDQKALSNSRARVYAALALKEMYLSVARPELAKAVGVLKRSTQMAYFSSLDQRQRIGSLNWLDHDVVRSIVEKLRAL